MLNQIVIMGRFVRDPELRRTQNGIAVTTFTLAVDRDFTPSGGERQTDFIDVVAWRNTAEFVSKYFVKGRMAVVEGRLQIRPWEDRDGNKRRSAEVVVNNIYFGDSKRQDDDRQGWQRSQNTQPSAPQYDADEHKDDSAYTPPTVPSGFSEIDDDSDLPF